MASKTMALGWLAVVMLAGSGPAFSDALYSNLGSGGTFDTGQAWSGMASGAAFAWQFTATSTGYATSIDAPIQSDVGAGPVTVTFSIRSDSANTIGSSLESTDMLSTGTSGSPTLANAALGGSTMLTMGVKYWLYGVGNAQWWWNLNNTSVTGLGYYNSKYWAGSDMLPAFRINGRNVSVPEPGTLVLLGLGLAGLGLSRRRKAN